MAKKKVEVTDYTVEEKLEALYKLQLVVSEIDRIRTFRGELPLEVQELEDEIEGRKTRRTKLESEIEQLNRYITERKHKIAEAQDIIAQVTKQLEDIRNNREYDALNKEIEFQNLEIQFCEKKITEDKISIEQITEVLNQLNAEIVERQAVLDEKQSELNEIIAETKQDEERLRMEAKEIEERIEPRLLTAFKRTRKASRNGLSVVTIEREACAGCFNKIPPQRQLDVKLRKKIIVCEYCGRILVDPEMADQIDSAHKR